MFDAVNKRYSAIVYSMPQDFQSTLDIIKDHISDDQISAILNCSDHVSGNKMILDCLMEKMQRKDDLLKLCDQLSRISSSPILSSLIDDIRKGI